MENIVVVNVPYVIVPSCQNCAIMSGRKAASRYTDPVQENNLSLAGTYALSSPLVPSIERNTSVDSQGRLLPNNLCTRWRNHFRNFIAPRWIPTSNQFSILATGWDSSARIRGHGTECRTVHPWRGTCLQRDVHRRREREREKGMLLVNWPTASLLTCDSRNACLWIFIAHVHRSLKLSH